MDKHRTDEPRTALGKKLVSIRKRIVASGAKLLSWDEIMKRLGKK